jgi:hypothetical protein
MKNYASNRAQKGKTAYRTPSLFKANKSMHSAQIKARTHSLKPIDFKDTYYGRS